MQMIQGLVDGDKAEMSHIFVIFVIVKNFSEKNIIKNWL